MRAPRRFLERAALALALAITLAGCMRVERTLQLNADGSGSYALTIGFREPLQGAPSSVPQSVETPMEAFGAHVNQTGGSYRRYEQAGYVYWTYIRPFSSIARADDLLQEDPRQFDSARSPVLYHDWLHVTEQTGLAALTFHVTGSISLADLFHNASNWSEATESLAIIMPAGISAHHGGVQVGHTVTYTIGYNQSATIDVTGRVPRPHPAVTNSTFLVAEGALALLALVLLGLGIRVLYGATRTPKR